MNGPRADDGLDRRELLRRATAGLGSVAAASLLPGAAFAGEDSRRRPHHRPRARSVIFLFMDGGPSAVDTFDPKERLNREHGQPFKMKKEPTQFNDDGDTLGSPWKFRFHGEAGIPVSSLFPNVATCVDDLAVIRSMVADFSEHTNANYYLHTGHGLQGRPSMGSWVTYGLGSPNRDLPGFVVLDGGLTPPGGLDNFSSGFLSARHRASVFQAKGAPIANIRAKEAIPGLQADKLALVRALDADQGLRLGQTPEIEAAVANYDLAFRMQAAVPDLVDLAGESASTRRSYGLEHPFPQTRSYGYQCLLARRLVERGVRFVELTCPKVHGDRWDQHKDLKKGHEANALAVDQPIAALLKDLKARGLLDETLVVWAGEFGRTPFAQGRDGRDHNPFGFSIWLAGGGIRGGTIYGATDEYGYKAVADRTTVHDLHATILHLLGIDHERLTYRFSGRDIRLTDVFGEVITGVLA